MRFPLNLFRIKLPVVLILIIAAILLFGNSIPLTLKEIFFSISLTLKSILLFFLPLIVFSYLSSCILSFKKGILTFISILLATVFISNFTGTLASYGSFLLFDSLNTQISLPSGSLTNSLTPFWSFNIPVFISNDLALYVSLIASIAISFIRSFAEKQNNLALLKITQTFEKFVSYIKQFSSFFLTRIFIPLVPIFITGYMIELQHSGSLNQIVTSYLPICLLIVSLQIVYILLMFGFISKFNFNFSYTAIRNVLPAAITGFSTMSSIAAMPFTLQAAEKNTNNPNLARILIPSTVNIHMVGNSLAMPIMVFACLLTFNVPMPDFQNIILFGLSFAFAQFAASGVPGGTIFIMIPLMEKFLGLTPDMISIITTLNILLDAPVTAATIFGNSALAIFLNNLFTKLKIVSN
ncbi:MAG: hypothetical protein C5B43_03745 [Verrucomicrobia bacterium]|nr:MAG: hypothetical protein C5B43_03745 [Verrucomicrobiota bacterium]